MKTTYIERLKFYWKIIYGSPDVIKKDTADHWDKTRGYFFDTINHSWYSFVSIVCLAASPIGFFLGPILRFLIMPFIFAHTHRYTIEKKMTAELKKNLISEGK